MADSPGDLQFPANNIIEIEVAGRAFCIIRKGNVLLCCPAKCPHAGGLFADGHLDGAGNIVCPAHGYKFDMANGRNISGEGYHLKTYPVEIREDGIYIGIER